MYWDFFSRRQSHPQGRDNNQGKEYFLEPGCVICYDKKRKPEIAFQPCRHQCVCNQCCYREHGPYANKVCPLCRAVVSQFIPYGYKARIKHCYASCSEAITVILYRLDE
jgi:hypothetical protein